jgi:hypothetical protein
MKRSWCATKGRNAGKSEQAAEPACEEIPSVVKLVSFKINKHGQFVRKHLHQSGKRAGKSVRELRPPHRTPPGNWLAATVTRLRLLIGKGADEAEQKRRFYEALLHIPWLPSRFRSAILKELGSSLRKQQRDFKRVETLALRFMINEAKARMQKQGRRERGGIHDAAVREIAQMVGMTPEALTKQLQRHK